MTLEDADTFARQWIAAWNSHDLDAILAHYMPDADFLSPVARKVTGDGRVIGVNALRAYWSKGLALNPALHFRLIEALAGDGCATIFYRNDRDQTVAETFEFDGTGRVVRAISCYSARPA